MRKCSFFSNESTAELSTLLATTNCQTKYVAAYKLALQLKLQERIKSAKRDIAKLFSFQSAKVHAANVRHAQHLFFINKNLSLNLTFSSALKSWRIINKVSSVLQSNLYCLIDEFYWLFKLHVNLYEGNICGTKSTQAPEDLHCRRGYHMRLKEMYCDRNSDQETVLYEANILNVTLLIFLFRISRIFQNEISIKLYTLLIIARSFIIYHQPVYF